MERRKFLGTSLGLGLLAGYGCSPTTQHATNVAVSGSYKLKGKSSSDVTHWDVITIGNLSRNRYWGESEDKSLHTVICTTTVITCNGLNIMVDPSLKDGQAMADELKRRTGLTPDNIDFIFVTHEHGDHHAGMPNFPKAKWLSSEIVANEINRTAGYSKKVEAVANNLPSSIDVVSTPGHTPGTAGLRFDYKGWSVFVAGDAVATKDFWDEGRMYFKALDMEESHKSLKKIASLANIVVPGHDNYFIVA